MNTATRVTTADVEADLRELGALLRQDGAYGRLVPDQLPMSADYGRLVTDLDDRVAIVAKHFPNLATVDGIRGIAGWRVILDDTLPTGVLVYAPGRLTIAAREAGDVEALLDYANQAQAARRELRRLVIETVGRVGLPSLRPFARPAGGTR